MIKIFLTRNLVKFFEKQFRFFIFVLITYCGMIILNIYFDPKSIRTFSFLIKRMPFTMINWLHAGL